MKKTILMNILIGMSCLGFILLVLFTFNKSQINYDYEFKELNIVDMENQVIPLEDNKYKLLVYFDSGCDHCQYELNSIKKNINKFYKTQIIFLSSEPMQRLRQFYKQNNIMDMKNTYLGYISHKNAYSKFNFQSVPSTQILNPQNTKIATFKGEVKIGTLLKYIQ